MTYYIQVNMLKYKRPLLNTWKLALRILDAIIILLCGVMVAGVGWLAWLLWTKQIGLF